MLLSLFSLKRTAYRQREHIPRVAVFRLSPAAGFEFSNGLLVIIRKFIICQQSLKASSSDPSGSSGDAVLLRMAPMAQQVTESML